MPSVRTVSTTLTIQMPKNSPALPLNSGMCRVGGTSGAGGGTAGGAGGSCGGWVASGIVSSLCMKHSRSIKPRADDTCLPNQAEAPGAQKQNSPGIAGAVHFDLKPDLLGAG